MKEIDLNAHLTLDTSAGEKRLDRYNSALYTFIGDNAMYDHVFYQEDGLSDDTFGTYVFRFNPAYAKMKVFMARERFPVHRNAIEVAQCDVDAYNGAVDRLVEPFDAIPEDWLS